MKSIRKILIDSLLNVILIRIRGVLRMGINWKVFLMRGVLVRISLRKFKRIRSMRWILRFREVLKKDKQFLHIFLYKPITILRPKANYYKINEYIKNTIHKPMHRKTLKKTLGIIE